MPLNQVVERYTILTIGDGLVSQIPALLISTAAGIIVTRATSESNLGRDLYKQVTSQPIVLILAAVFLFIMAFRRFSQVGTVYFVNCNGLPGIYFDTSFRVSLPETEDTADLEKLRKCENRRMLLNFLK